jgi:hypothetical protein
MYPSGHWTGFWEQPGWGKQPMHDLELYFAEGAIEGHGRDCIGAFTFEGTYERDGSVAMTKQYLGRHRVLYHGSYDGEGTVFGRWSIGTFWSGPFALRFPRQKAHVGAAILEISLAPT